ncbi:MAG: hypothetical protein OEY29_16035, partial [Gammaproteobacteria bacterium]|nr:hypothetical protein [Gammaproteobacteria bacterium]
GPQISSVWTWLAHRAKIDFIQNPDPKKLLSQPGWLRYFQSQSPKAFLTNLHSIQVNRAYLVNLEGTEVVTLSIAGAPVVPRIKWQPSAFNHIGFHVDPANAPTFSEFFDESPAHKNQPVYKLVHNEWQRVDVFSTAIESDTAYWVFSNTGSEYTGPLHIDLPQSDRLDYDLQLDEFITRFQNKTTKDQTFSVRIISGASGLIYPNPDTAAVQKWLPLPQPYNAPVSAQAEKRLTLAIRRADFHPANFTETLEVKSSSGSRWLIPVTASAPPLNSLYVGSVTIDKVSQAQLYQHNCVENKDTDGIRQPNLNNGTGYDLCLDDNRFPVSDVVYQMDCVETKVDGTRQPNLLTAGTGAELCVDDNSNPVLTAGADVMTDVASNVSFRIILHRDTAQQVRLLKDVILMWKPTLDDPATPETETGGRYVLLTDDTLISQYSGVDVRDGEAVGRRISSVAYDFPGQTVDMTGGMTIGETLSVTLTMGNYAPTNPFKHAYHAQHNGLAADYVTPSKEAYAVTRTIELTFTADDTGTPGAGYDHLTGTYREAIYGLHKNPIYTSGTFRLRETARTEELNK